MKSLVSRLFLALSLAIVSVMPALAVDTTVADLAAAADITTLKSTQNTFLIAGIGITLGFVAFALIRKSMNRMKG